MSLINKPKCYDKTGNTGTNGCPINLGLIRGVLFFDSPVEFPALDLSALQTAITAAILADNSRERIYPVPNILTLAANNEDSVTQTFTDGTIAFVREGKYNMTFTYLDGGLTRSNALRQYIGKNRYFMLYDDQGQLWAQKSTTEGNIRPYYTSYFDPKKFTPNTGAAVTQYDFSMQWEPVQMNENAAVIDFSSMPGFLADLRGLIDINLSQSAPRVGGVMHIKLYAGGQDLFDSYSTVLAAAAAWVATKAVDGSVVAVTGVTADATTKSFTVTTANTADDLKLTLIGPTELATDPYNVDGFEADKILIPHP